MIVSWSALKEFCISRSLPVQWVEDSEFYYLAAGDRYFQLECQLNKLNPNEDFQDFETNYKTAFVVDQLDTDGAQIVRQKAAKKGWTYTVIPIEFQTSRLSDSVYSKHYEGTDRSGISLKAYNNSDVEVTTPGIANVNYASIVKTVIDFEPEYDYEVIGGFIRTINDISSDIRLWIVAVPDISAGSGGSKEMVSGLNLNYMKPENVYFVDGRVTKFLSYNATYHTNKLRFILKYPAATNENVVINIELYKQ